MERKRGASVMHLDHVKLTGRSSSSPLSSPRSIRVVIRQANRDRRAELGCSVEEIP
jgi:hypothetical protein